jgi:histidine triad (HIT) family protein
MACLFCEIVSGTIPVKKIHEDEWIIAFEDIHPQAPTHLLLIPKLHIENLNAVESDHAEVLSKLLMGAKDLAKHLGFNESGYRLVINTNQDGGQTVFHLHVHLLGGRPLTWPPG